MTDVLTGIDNAIAMACLQAAIDLNPKCCTMAKFDRSCFSIGGSRYIALDHCHDSGF